MTNPDGGKYTPLGLWIQARFEELQTSGKYATKAAFLAQVAKYLKADYNQGFDWQLTHYKKDGSVKSVPEKFRGPIAKALDLNASKLEAFTHLCNEQSAMAKQVGGGNLATAKLKEDVARLEKQVAKLKAERATYAEKVVELEDALARFLPKSG